MQPKRPGTQPPETDRFCKIVTFYEDFADAIRAVQKFDLIVQAFSGERHVLATSWSFDMLGRRNLNSIILDDVSHADVIVVASHGDRPLPERIASWVAICMAAIRTKKPVLVALHNDGMEEEGVAAPLCKSLKDIASRADASFMCNHGLAQCLKESAQRKPGGGGRDARRPAAEPAQFSITENLRWWGIND
jgi:hypothetical protein